MASTQVSEMPIEASRHDKLSPSSFNKRARVSPAERVSFCSSYNGGDTATLPTEPETPTSNGRHTATAAGRTRSSEDTSFSSGGGGGYPRAASPTPSYASSSTTFSAATTSATALSSRASLSSCRSSSTCPFSSSSSSSSYRGKSRHDRGSGSSGRRSSYASSRPSSMAAGADGGGGVDYFPQPSASWSGGRRSGSSSSAVCGGDGASWRRRDSSGRRDRCSSRGRQFFCPLPTRRSSTGKDYASEASSSTRKRNRSCSRERSSRGDSRGRSSKKAATTAESRSGVECARCLEWCRSSRTPKTPIPRTLPMEYWVRTPNCKAAKSKHIDFIDDVAYSREQFIEETVFTCPFTGARRDIVLERNMFPYDVPTDVEHWTLWSRRDLPKDEMEAFVQGWAAENHPHAVEWECDNNEGERSIDWFHVHVFFRLGCEDRTGVPRDPASVYDGPCGSAVAGGQEEDEDEDGAVVVGGGADEETSNDRDDRSCALVATDC
ncbi:unnamed protein product [Ectocarpus sp. CCAP 1310/34]|nr:unnamed protein product [Ectocarpus sp. CCAP 1310/34]